MLSDLEIIQQVNGAISVFEEYYDRLDRASGGGDRDFDAEDKRAIVMMSLEVGKLKMLAEIASRLGEIKDAIRYLIQH
jgi:hypothetical protein